MNARTWAMVLVASTLLALVGIQGPALASDPVCDLVASTAGANSNPGTVEAPLGTVQELVNRLGPGQTGCLRGTSAATPFSEDVTVSNKNATAPPPPSGEASRITIRNYPGEVAKLRGRLFIDNTARFIAVKGLVLDGTPANASGPRVDGDYASFTDNNITNAAGACFRVGVAPAAGTTSSVPGVSILRNRIHDCKFEAINLARTGIANVQTNLIYDNGDWGVKLHPGANSSWITRNIIDGNGGGILFGGDATRASDWNLFDSNIVSRSSPSRNVGYAYTSPFMPTWNYVWRACLFAPNNPNGGFQVNPQPRGFQTASPIVIREPIYRNRSEKDFTPQNPGDPCFAHSGDVAGAVAAGGGPTDEQASAGNPKPNVLFIVTDDQRADGTLTSASLPQTISRLRNVGTEYRNAFATTPLCCPSRSSILTGRYAHNHDVHQNQLGDNLNFDTTLPRYLKSEAGYRTGIFGKFLNGWDLDVDPPASNWDEWAIFREGFCTFDANEQGNRVTYGSGAVDTWFTQSCPQGSPYSTDYVRDKANAFIDGAENADSQPWFLYVAPNAPHQPSVPEYDYRNLDVGPFQPGAASSEGQPGGDPITDKPQWIQWLCKDSHPAEQYCQPNSPPEDRARQQQLRSLRSVDDMVASLLDRLEAQGEQDTMVVFVSDNGFMWGEHGIGPTKSLPYTESIKIPMSMRYAPVTVPGAKDDRLVANIDLAPTVLAAAGLSTNRSPELDGFSLLSSTARPRMLTETQNHRDLTDDGDITDGEPSEDLYSNWASIRTTSYQYIEGYHEDGKTVHSREYYDLTNDPNQLSNVLQDGNPGNDPSQATLDALRDQLRRDRFCRGAQCPGGNQQGPDTDPLDPRGSITLPAGGSYVCCRVRLRAIASDNLGVTSVQFFEGSNPIGSPDTSFPYETVWDSGSQSQPAQTRPADLRVQVTDSSGRSASSPVTSVNLDRGLDIQVENGGGQNVLGRPDTGDTITFSFGRVVAPGDFLPGWDGMPSNCTLQPGSCVTVRLVANQLGSLANDKVKVLSDTAPNPVLAQFGTVDLGLDNYNSADRDFTHSTAELTDGGKSIRIRLGAGAVSANQSGKATATWATSPGSSFCGSCHIFESLDGIDTTEDREF